MEITINIDTKDIIALLKEPTIRAEIRKIAAEEANDRARKHLQATLPPEFLQALQKQFPYLKLYEPDKPNPAHLQH